MACGEFWSRDKDGTSRTVYQVYHMKSKSECGCGSEKAKKKYSQ